MTVGELSRRTGTPVKALRRYEQLGLIYTVGRSSANYRLFDESALWCIQVIHNLRALGLTVAEISDLAGIYLGKPDLPIGPELAERLRTVRARIDDRIGALQEVRRRMDDFETRYEEELSGRTGSDFRATDPRFRGDGP
jgi:MerR family transcriptional regulator, copper efflux regulator